MGITSIYYSENRENETMMECKFRIITIIQCKIIAHINSQLYKL